MTISLLDAFKTLRHGNIDVPENMAYPLLVWASNDDRNLAVCKKVNSSLFFSSARMNLALLSLGRRDTGFVRYPKLPKAEADKHDEARKDFVKGVLGWSEREYAVQSQFVDVQELAVRAGLSNEERRKLGLEKLKLVVPPMKRAMKGWGSYG
jgi:hypothetical protein